MNSLLLALNKKDFLKGAVVAFLTPIVLQIGVILQDMANGQPLVFDWAMLLKMGLAAGFAYIVKNYFSDSQGNPLGVGSPHGTE